MPELPEYYRQQRLTTGGGGAVGGGHVPDTALQETGAVLTQAGLAGLDQFFKAQETDQINTFRAETLTAINKYQQTFDPKGDTEGFESGFQDILKERSTALAKLSNSRARTNNEDWLQGNSPGWQSRIAGQSRIAQMGQFEDRDMVAREALMQRAIESSPEDYDESMAVLEDQIMRGSGRYIEGQDFLLRSGDEGQLLWNDAQKSVKIGRKRFVAEAEQGFIGQRIDDTTAAINKLPAQDREAALLKLPSTEWERADLGEVRDRVERQMEAEQEAVYASSVKLLTQEVPDFSGAKDILNENMSQFGTKWHDAALTDIQTTSKILTDTGVNAYTTTVHPEVYDKDEQLAFDGKLSLRDIQKHTGPDGYSDTDARRLREIIKDPVGQADPTLKDALAEVEAFADIQRKAVSELDEDDLEDGVLTKKAQGEIRTQRANILSKSSKLKYDLRQLKVKKPDMTQDQYNKEIKATLLSAKDEAAKKVTDSIWKRAFAFQRRFTPIGAVEGIISTLTKDRVRVKKPDGTIGTVDKKNLPEAQKAGFEVIE